MNDNLRFRTFSSAYNFQKAAPSFLYGMDANRVITADDGSLITGALVPISVNGDGAVITATPAATYTSFSASITGSQTQIPTGAYQWSIMVQSGVAFMGSVPLFAVSTVNGGGYDGGKKLSAPITVGCTGGRTLVTWEL